MNAKALARSSVGAIVGHNPTVHAFRPPTGDVSRSPCPGLNTLANHSYLPHDGRNITIHKLVSALRNGMGFSPGFAVFMGIGTFVLLRRPSLAPFDLQYSARHNYIEHNASMVHADARPSEEYAPCAVDLQLLNEFLAMARPSETSCSAAPSGAGEHVITAREIATRRVEREAVSLPVDALHAELGRAEFALVMETFGRGGGKELNRADMKVFLEENRMPDGWVPSHTMHLWDVVSRSATIRHAMKELKKNADREHVQAHDGGMVEWVKSIMKKLSNGYS